MDRDTVKFKLEGDPVEYVLTYDFNEIVDAEAATGCNLFRAMSGSMTATEFRALLYACLKTGHPQVLLKEAGDLVSKDRTTVMVALGKVLAGAEEEATEETLAPEATTATA